MLRNFRLDVSECQRLGEQWDHNADEWSWAVREITEIHKNSLCALCTDLVTSRALRQCYSSNNIPSFQQAPADNALSFFLNSRVWCAAATSSTSCVLWFQINKFFLFIWCSLCDRDDENFWSFSNALFFRFNRTVSLLSPEQEKNVCMLRYKGYFIRQRL